MVCSGANGLGLALVIPATQSLVADLYPPEARGRAFGFLLLFSGIGARGFRFTGEGLWIPEHKPEPSNIERSRLVWLGSRVWC